MRTVALALLLLSATLTVGCAHRNGGPYNVVPRIVAHEKATESIKKDVTEGTDIVESNTKEIEQKLSPEQKKLVQANIDAIKDACLKKFRVAIEKLGLLQDDLAETKRQVAGLEAENAKLAKDLTTANSKGKQFFYAAMAAMAVVGAGCLAFGIITLLSGNRKGITIALSGVAMTVVALVVGQYTVWFLIGGIVVLTILTFITIGDIKKRERKAEEETKRADEEKQKGEERSLELVNSVEMLKDFVPEEVKPHLFGAHSNDPGMLADVQSESTQSFVKQARKSTKVRTVTAKTVVPVVDGTYSGS